MADTYPIGLRRRDTCPVCGQCRWISVKERTPRNTATVLVRLSWDRYFLAWYLEEECCWRFPPGTPDYWQGEVTHWRAIDPPEDCHA